MILSCFFMYFFWTFTIIMPRFTYILCTFTMILPCLLTWIFWTFTLVWTCRFVVCFKETVAETACFIFVRERVEHGRKHCACFYVDLKCWSKSSAGYGPFNNWCLCFFCRTWTSRVCPTPWRASRSLQSTVSGLWRTTNTALASPLRMLWSARCLTVSFIKTDA